MSIVFSRIDDRLIHGQVMTTWVNLHNVEQIIVLNDRVAQDQTQKSILNMAAPPGIAVKVFPVEKFGQILKKTTITRRTMLLFTNSEDVLLAVKAGVPITELNVGGMRYHEGREKLTKSVAVTESELDAFKELLARNLEVTIQMVHNDERVLLEEVLK